MESKYEDGHQPEGYYEHEVEVAEDKMVEKDNKNDEVAFLADHQREESPGNAASEGVRSDPPHAGPVHADFMERRNAGVIDRRHTAT